MPGDAAAEPASHKAELVAPLLVCDADSTAAGSSAASGASAPGPETAQRAPTQALKSAAVHAGLLGGTLLSVAAMATSPSVAICVMGGLCFANASYSAVKERKIAVIPSLRAANDKLKENAKGLEVAVEALTKEVDQLRPEATRAAIVEEELGSVASAHEVNVERLMELVRENSAILSKMRDNLRQRIVQVIISIVVKSDKDNNQTISHKEAKTLALHIRIALQEYDVLFDTDKFLRAIGGDTTVSAIIAIVQRLLPGEPAGGNGAEEGGSSSEDDMYDMFHMVDEGSTTAKGVSLMTCDRKNSFAKQGAAPNTTDQYLAVMEEKIDSTYESFPESEAGSDEASRASDPYEL